MPALKDLLEFICAASAERGVPFGDKCAREMEMEIRKHWPAERIYIPPADSQKGSGRQEAIRQASARLPTGVVAERYGVTRQYVARVIKKRT